jgi:hypothetical protein
MQIVGIAQEGCVVLQIQDHDVSRAPQELRRFE